MAPKIDLIQCARSRYIADSKVCAKNLFILSNNDVKTVLSKYSSLSSEEKDMVKRFSDDLQVNHVNRYRNLSKFFKQAYDSVKPSKKIIKANATVNEPEKNSNDVKVSANTSNKIEQKIVTTNKPSTNNKSVAPCAKQESTIAPFHTNIISRVNNNNNNINNNMITNTNPFYSTIFPKIHQKVLNQCITSMLLPQAIMNNAINNITAVLNLTQNTNPTLEHVNNQMNTPVESQKELVKDPPSKFQSDQKYTSNTSVIKIEQSEKMDSAKNTTNNNGQSEKASKNHKENQLNNNNNNRKEATTKCTPKNTIKIEPNSTSNNKNKKTKESETVQDLESFSMEHMKKIESFAQHNALKNSIKLNLSSNSQMKISETYSKIKQQTEPKITNLNGIKRYFDDTCKTDVKNTENNNKMVKETDIIKTCYNEAKRRLNEYAADNVENDQKNVKSKVIKTYPDNHSVEKCSSYSNDHRKNAPPPSSSSNSDFLSECNLLKSIISKNSNTAENSSKKEEKLEVVLTKKSKKKRKRNKAKNKELQCVKLNGPSVLIPEEKNQIDQPENKTTTNLTKQVEIHEKKPQKREVKVVNRVLRTDSPNDQIIKSMSEKPFTEECNKTATNDPILATKQDVKCKLNKTIDTEDLMVLLKYFYKLDGLEQHRLIEFLKELELTEPERVADLRKHVRTSPPDDEDNNVIQNTQFATEKDSSELEDRPESRNSDLSNIDLILDDIDSILNDEDDEESSNNNKKEDECIEPPSKRLKTDLKSNELTQSANCDSTVSFGKTIPVQFKNSQNNTFNSNQIHNNYSNITPLIQYNNLIQQNINYIAQQQNYEYNYQNQYYQNNLQETYQFNQLFVQNQGFDLQNQQNALNHFQDFQNICFNYNNQVEQYQQNYTNYYNGGYF